jgi:hypothetical protein
MDYDDPLVYQVALILQAAGAGTFKTDIFVGKEPDSPDDCITLYDTGGIPDDCLDRTSRGAEQPNFQVRVRSNNYLIGHAIMNIVRTTLEKKKNTVTDSGGTVSIDTWLTTLPNNIQRDTKNRAILTANFSAIRSVV